MKYFMLIIFCIFTQAIFAQEDLLGELEKETKKEVKFEMPAFKAMQIANMQSTKIASHNDIYFIVTHRFGSFKTGFDNFFGLDQANTKIQVAYGLFDIAQISISRDSYEKTYSGAVKASIVKQSNKFPLNIVGYLSADINSELKKSDYPNMKFPDRMSYTAQLLVSRRMFKWLSLQIMPIYVRQNLQDINFTGGRTHDQFLLGAGGRVKVSKRISINIDYAFNFIRHKDAKYHNPLTLGVDIETGGHVFQLVLSNASGSNDSGLLSRTQGDWLKGDISFGFNIVRVF